MGKLECCEWGSNSLTEKHYRQDGLQYFAVDIDFKTEDLISGAYLSKEELIDIMRRIVEICDEVVQAKTGISEQRHVASRLFYKLHIYYPVVVTKDSACNLAEHIRLKCKSDSQINAVYS